MSKLNRLEAERLSTNPRATLSAWQRYEPIVLKAFAHAPMTFAYVPTSMSPATVASRLRDAIRGALAFAYPAKLDHEVLSSWWSTTIVRHNKTHVYIGPKEKTESEPLEVEQATPFTFASLTLDELNAFTLLLGNGRIVGPVLIKNFVLPEGHVPHPNVESFPQPNGSLLLL